MLVRHNADRECAGAVIAYQKLLKHNDITFLDCPLGRLVSVLRRTICSPRHKEWLAAFRQRYVELSLSGESWRMRYAKGNRT